MRQSDKENLVRAEACFLLLRDLFCLIGNSLLNKTLRGVRTRAKWKYMHKSRWIKNRTCGIYLDVIYLHHIQNADASYVCRTLKFRAVQFRNSAASQETPDVF